MRGMSVKDAETSKYELEMSLAVSEDESAGGWASRRLCFGVGSGLKNMRECIDCGCVTALAPSSGSETVSASHGKWTIVEVVGEGI